MLKFKKIISLLMIIFILFTSILPVLANTGTGNWTGGQYGSQMFTTDSNNNGNGVLIRRLTNLDTGEKHTVFCVEHGVRFITGNKYEGKYYTVTDELMKKVCKIAYFGWYSKFGDYVVDGGILSNEMIDVKYAYVFTQQFMWESLGQSNGTFVNPAVHSK